MKKSNLTHIIYGTIILLILTVALSYAYFTANIHGSETESTIFADGGMMDIYYVDGTGEINASKIIPKNTPFADKDFTITGNNSTSETMYYNLNLVIENNTFTDYAISYKLTSTNTNSNGTIVPSSTKDMCYLLNGPQTEVLGSGTFTGPTNGNKTHTYNLKMYFPDTDELQNENFNKTIAAYIKTEEGEKTGSKCKQIPVPIGDIILANNGGIENIIEAPTSIFNSINTSDENKMYKMEDDYGDSYYFRGAKTYVNNNLIFANHQWKIIRINGDGSLRIIYNGTCPGNQCTINTTGTGTHMMLPSGNSLYNSDGWSAYNLTNYNDNKHVGYMFGGAAGAASTSREQATTNETSSTIKTYLDTWYVTNIQGTEYESYISDTLFCNDRQLQDEVGGNYTGTGFGNSETYYAAFQRLSTTKNPNLKCAQKNDRFTVSDTTKGNGALTYPIGLLTLDETAVAGLKYSTSNSSNYLYTNQSWWTSGPNNFFSRYAFVSNVGSGGGLDIYFVFDGLGARGVLNLASNTPITGTGTTLDPYVVQ